MSAAVGAALKKIAVALLTNKKVLKTLVGIVLGIIVIVIMPAVAVVSLFNGKIEIDTGALQQQIVAQMSEKQIQYSYLFRPVLRSSPYRLRLFLTLLYQMMLPSQQMRR